ncbi:MAG: hypothetical protein E7653_07265 [Ruminococcaceae bacterium]|nr:hypothetical protein [Oscillospiraceae bacterium]
MKYIRRFFIGGALYFLLEYTFRTTLDRGDTHPMMLVLGGLSLVSISIIEDKLKCSIFIKAILGGLAVTFFELIIGGYYMYVLHDPIWFYGTAAIFKVISVTWSMLWCALSLIVLIVLRLLAKLEKKLS